MIFNIDQRQSSVPLTFKSKYEGIRSFSVKELSKDDYDYDSDKFIKERSKVENKYFV